MNHSLRPILNSSFKGLTLFIAHFPFTIMQDFAGNCATRLVPCLLTQKGEIRCEHGHEINKTVENLMPLFKGSRRRERSHETDTSMHRRRLYRQRRLHAVEAIVVVLWKLIECI